jgi:hypothetical protein
MNYLCEIIRKTDGIRLDWVLFDDEATAHKYRIYHIGKDETLCYLISPHKKNTYVPT